MGRPMRPESTSSSRGRQHGGIGHRYEDWRPRKRRRAQEFLLGEHLWLVLHHSQASSILVFDLLQGDEREKMAIRPHYKAPAADD